MEQILADLDAFRDQCEAAEYTDSGDAWNMIDRLESALREERDALAALRTGVEAVIAGRYAGDFAPILPKLRALLDDPSTRPIPPINPNA